MWRTPYHADHAPAKFVRTPLSLLELEVPNLCVCTYMYLTYLIEVSGRSVEMMRNRNVRVWSLWLSGIITKNRRTKNKAIYRLSLLLDS